MNDKKKKVFTPKKSAEELVKLQEWERHFYNCKAISLASTIQFGILAQIMIFITNAILLFLDPREAFFIAIMLCITGVSLSHFAQGQFTIGQERIGLLLKLAAVICLVLGSISTVCGFNAFIN